MLFRAIVKPSAAESSSTLGLALTVTSIFVTCGRRFRISCRAGPANGACGCGIGDGTGVGVAIGAGAAKGVFRGCMMFLTSNSLFNLYFDLYLKY